MSSFTTNLARSGVLQSSDIELLDETLKPHLRTFEAGQILVALGTAPKFVHLILGGWACRYKRLRDDRRQIIAFVIPKDISDLNILQIPRIDHEMACLTAVVAAELPQHAFDAFFTGDHPRIAQAFRERAVVTASIQREWLVNLGLRSAPERIAHLLCEMFHRLDAISMTVGGQYTLPLTQGDIADALGLSLVHVNKRLHDLRTTGLISLKHRYVTIHDLPALEELAFFDPSYLNVNGRDEQLLGLTDVRLPA
jgi:CRP-like cAMP-binding protein